MDKFYCVGITDTNVRDNNEDCFLIAKKVIRNGVYDGEINSPFIAAVADGVAGEKSGEKASYYTLKHLKKLKLTQNLDYAKEIKAIHEKIKLYGTKKKSANMQTTLCALIIDNDGNAFIVNVGDSRLYRFRNGIIKQLSSDQSLVQALYEQGSIAHEQKINHVRKNVIFPVIGCLTAEPEIKITKIEGGILPTDIILLCTDGLSDYVTTGDIEEVLSYPNKLTKRLELLVKKAIDNNSRDNITALAIGVKTL